MNKSEQLEQLVDYYSGGNKTKFAAKLGISPQGISTWKGRNTFDMDLIFAKCENISPRWLLSGEGPMIESEHSPGVPFYDVDFCGGFDIMLNDQTIAPAGYIDFPQYNRADCWARITGHSMEPLISNGDIIALRKIDDWRTYLLYGEIYGVVTDEYRTVKRVRKSENPDILILEPINKDFDSTDIERSLITSMWAVLGCAKKFF